MARGILVTEMPSAKIVAIRPGQVTELLVREGQLVRAGQRIATIRTEEAGESGGSAIGEGLTALDVQGQIAQQQERLAGRRTESERTRLTATLAGLRRQRSDLETQITLQGQTAASARELFDRIQTLRDSGFVSRIEIEQRRQALLFAQRELARLRQLLSSLDSDSAQAAAELSRIAVEGENDIARARSAVGAFAQQRAQLRGGRAYVIVAPISGRVAALQTSLGRTAGPNMPLMEIVPEGSAVHAQIYAPTRAIGFVHTGQEVRLLYDAFPYQRFGSFRGRIVNVSRAVIDPNQLAAPLDIEEPVYRVDVVPDEQMISAFGQRLELQPGMTLHGRIILDRRSFLDWLLQPLNAVMRRNA